MVSELAVPSRVPQVRSYAHVPDVLEVPNLVQVQLDSYDWFRGKGLGELLRDISPIEDFTGTRFELTFLNPNKGPEYGQSRYEFRPPKHDEAECRLRDLTYASPLFVTVWLKHREAPQEYKESVIFLGDFPLMTRQGTFIVNGAERVVVSQLVRSPGVYLTLEEDVTTGRNLCYAKLIPDRGAWLEFETSNRDVVSVKVDGKRKIAVTTLLRAIGYSNDEKLKELFQDVDKNPDHHYIQTTIDWQNLELARGGEEEKLDNQEKALRYIFRRLRPGDPANLENAQALIKNLLFNPRRYDLGRVGRYKLNQRLGKDLLTLRGALPEERVLTPEDLVAIGRHIIRVDNGEGHPDDIDHLGNRRVRTVGELIQNQFRIGLLRLERVVKERMSIIDPKVATPANLINIRPVIAALREFFGGSQLSQFMDQTNPLAELTHKRRLSALGPGGLSRERAGFDVRDVHHSHYGRVCPIETPEGPNIGLIGSLATYARLNPYGFIETPYRRVTREFENADPRLIGRTLREKVTNREGKAVAEAGSVVDEKLFQRLSRLAPKNIPLVPSVSSSLEDIEYLSADREEDHTIAQANTRLDAQGHFLEEKVEVRRGSRYSLESPLRIDYMDVSPKQIVSVATSLIPFLEHDDANRALMGSNMQRQSVPLLQPRAPILITGMERLAGRDSGQVVFARREGTVASVTSNEIRVVTEEGEEVHPLMKFIRTNQGTCLNQRPLVDKGERVRAGQVLADSSSTDGGELALGDNVLVAFMSWEGYNFEDAVIISESLIRADRFSSIHIEKHEMEARETKLGPEEITRDIPNVGEESLRDLDENGIIRLGAEVGPGDILVGKITPKGETELTPEEKLLRAIFGEKARDVKDTSLRIPHGEKGKVIAVKVFSREAKDELPAGVIRLVRVWVAQRRKLSVGDKMAGRHGNKGVIARILPDEDMPLLPDGRHVEIILNPISVPSRMNLGQVLETHLGGAAFTMGFRATCPVFQGATSEEIEEALAQAWLVQRSGALQFSEQGRPQVDWGKARPWLTEKGFDPEKVFSQVGEARRTCLRVWLEDQGENVNGIADSEVEALSDKLVQEKRLSPPIHGKVVLRDGRTGEPFDQPVTVGHIYMMKLIHLVEDKIHARSIGPYSLITQQPLGGKAQFGGQRFGEMEVWALEAYGAAHILQELLTVKSDDVLGRAKTYEAIIKGEEILQPGVPESFKVLLQELKSLGLAVEVLNEAEEKVSLAEEETFELPRIPMDLPPLKPDLEKGKEGKDA
ncbi:MAG: DNA-directed RNA polymerase subunit beta [Chloroflexi bacterium]|nr:DNA-directed RNA polymerase subunit beta [Chloroflexota bacterium]